VEVSIMLAVLAVLAGALLPVASDSVSTARAVRARNDLAQISAGLVNFIRDVGPFVFDGTDLRSSELPSGSLRPVRLLVSDGAVPEHVRDAPRNGLPGGLIVDERSFATVPQWTLGAASDVLDMHLRFNARNYPVVVSGPGTGWNGPYIAREIAGDPWGNRYMINVAYLRGMPKGVSDCSSCAVFVLSAGPNGVVETPFTQQIGRAMAVGDDVVVRIQ
jgi:type II secretory pathway pseudopilin PulG